MFDVWCLGFWVSSLGVPGSEVWGSGFRASGFRVPGFELADLFGWLFRLSLPRFEHAVLFLGGIGVYGSWFLV